MSGDWKDELAKLLVDEATLLNVEAALDAEDTARITNPSVRNRVGVLIFARGHVDVKREVLRLKQDRHVHQ